MASYVIEGSRPIEGSTTLPGAKNAVTKMLIASLLSEEESLITGVPPIREIDLTISLLRSLGAQIDRDLEAGTVKVLRSSGFHNRVGDAEAKGNRMAVLAVAPLLHAFGRVDLPRNLGGDRIGPRPVDFHLEAFRNLGASIEVAERMYRIRCDGLRGANIVLPFPSVSTTENILLAASLARGTSVIRNAAVEPEVLDLVLFLQKMGAIIEQNTDRTYVVEGVDRLGGATHRVLPDRITGASLGVLAIATGGRIEVKGARQEHMICFLNTLRRMGAPFKAGDDGIVFGNGKKEKLRSLSMETNVHPGFMTDWQPPMVVLMTRADGHSILHETVYENRLEFTTVLNQMGANIQVEKRCLGNTPCRFKFKDHRHSCIVQGPTPLKGMEMTVPDLRAGFTYVIGALCAEGTSVIHRVEEIERGYGELHTVLAGMGAAIERRE